VRVFLTGGSGYLGRALAARLVADGHEVRALVRPTSRREELAGLGAALFEGDVIDRASMREAMSGADLVVHAAADLDLTGPPGRMEAVNVGGSENVASLAFKLGVPKFLSVSSIAWWGGSPHDGTPGVETSPPLEPFPTRYSDTKHRGEHAIRAWAERGFELVTVYPSLIYGPPGKKDGANALLRQLWLGRFPVMVESGKKTTWLYLEDAVDGIVRAIERAPAGAGYLLAGEIRPIREVAQAIAALGGAKPPRFEISVRTARRLVHFAAPFYRLRGRRLPMPIAQLASLERHWAFDDSKARQELDWQPRGLDEGLRLTVEKLFGESSRTG